MPITYIVVVLVLPLLVQGMSNPRAFAEVLQIQRGQKTKPALLSEFVQETLANEWNPMEGLSNAMDSAGKAVAGVTSAAEKAIMAPLLGDYMVDSLELQNVTKVALNIQVMALVGFVLLVCGAAAYADSMRKEPRRNNAPSYLTATVLLCSYMLLIPGLFSTLFSFLIGVDMIGINILLSQEDGSEPSQVEKSTITAIELLFKTGGQLGAWLLIIYAIVVPVVKLVLISVAEARRHDQDVEKVKSARKYINFVQLISKWACPDMFAYIFLLYLFRHLDGLSSGPARLHAPAELGVGFACFTLFCVGSTFAAVAVDPPEVPVDEEENRPAPPWTVRLVPLPSLHVVIAVLLGAFAVFYVAGMLLPFMGMRLDSAMLIQPVGPLPASAQTFIDQLHIEDMVHSDVSFARCAYALLQYSMDGELCIIFAMIMVLVFAMLFPVVDMCVLMWASWKMGHQPPDVEAATNALKTARWLKHGCMLDVALMGVVVVTFAGAAYKKQGVILLMMPGLGVLFLAEVVHYVAYYLVHDTVIWRATTKT